MKLGGMEKEVELRRSKKLMGDEGGISEVESGSVSGPRSKSIDEDQPLSKKKTIKLSHSTTTQIRESKAKPREKPERGFLRRIAEGLGLLDTTSEENHDTRSGISSYGSGEETKRSDSSLSIENLERNEKEERKRRNLEREMRKKKKMKKDEERDTKERRQRKGEKKRRKEK
ncbi:hypothetical protein QC760_010643 [Botrytis cinerea]